MKKITNYGINFNGGNAVADILEKFEVSDYGF